MSLSADVMHDIPALMREICQKAKAAERLLARAETEEKDRAIVDMATELRMHSQDILAANAKDLEIGQAKGLSEALLDRLTLTEERIEAMAKGVEAVGRLPDPIGEKIGQWLRPNGLKIDRIRVPLGVIGVIYESRPNVTADAAALCLKAGNAVILRGGSESFHSNQAIAACLAKGLREGHLPEDAIQLVPTTDRDAVGALLKADEFVDVIIPRGGRSLIERVRNESRVPVLSHLDGLCHSYIHKAADKDMAHQIVLNAKMRRTGICGATETLLVDREIAASHLPDLLSALMEAGCEVRGDADVQTLDPRVQPAQEQDWQTEYLDAILSVKLVKDLEEAISHINQYGSHHTEAIITEDQDAADLFLSDIDAGIVIHNSSTQYADGGEFGMGAEIGISTGKLHARGPVGVEQLTSYKYRVRGKGQVRP